MADKTPKQGNTPLEQTDREQTDRVLYKEIAPGIYALTYAAALMIGSNLLSATNRLPTDANMQIGDVDVGLANRVPGDANLQVGDIDVGVANPVPTDANMQVGGVDVGVANPIPSDANLQIAGVDVSATNPVTITEQYPVEIILQPTITAGVYAAGDALGGLLNFANAARLAGSGGTITKIVIVDDDSQLAPVDVVFFDRTFTATADNAPFDPTDADLENCIGYVNVAATDYGAFNDNSVAVKCSGLQMPFDYVLNGTSLFAQMVVRSGPTYASTSSLTVKITVQRK